MGLIELIFLMLVLVASYLLYSYISYYESTEKGIKVFFKPKLHTKALVLTIVLVAISVASWIFGRKMNDYSAIQCYLNVAVLMLLAAMSWVDIKEKIIPNKLILVGLGIWLVEVAVEVFWANVSIKDVLAFSALGGFLWGGIFVIIGLITKAALGMGDAKMFFVIGLIYGMNNTYSILLLSMILMAIVSIILLMLKKVDRKTAVPMAPFVLLGFSLCIFLGM